MALLVTERLNAEWQDREFAQSELSATMPSLLLSEFSCKGATRYLIYSSP